MAEQEGKTGVILDGQFYPIHDQTEWEQWQKFLTDFFVWQTNRPQPPVPEPREQSQPEVPTRASVARKWAKNAPGTRTIDAVVLALEANGNTLDFRTIVALLPGFGWDLSLSNDPIALVKARAQSYRDLVQVKKGHIYLLPGGEELVKQIKGNQSATLKEV